MSEAIALKFKLVHRYAKLPTKKRKGDTGLDLYCPEDVSIDPMSQTLVNLGIQSEFPDMWTALIWDRSSVALKGCHVTAGCIDSSYRGDWKISLWNLGDKPVGFSRGEKIAQVLLLPIINILPREVSELSETPRGDGGFGSTGKF